MDPMGTIYCYMLVMIGSSIKQVHDQLCSKLLKSPIIVAFFLRFIVCTYMKPLIDPNNMDYK